MPKKTKTSKAEKKIERQLFWILGFFVLIVVVFIGASAYFKGSNQVKYQGLTFTKEKFGELLVYHYSYYFKTEAGKLIQYNLFIRTDPSKNSVPVIGDPLILNTKSLYLTLNTAYLDECNKSAVAIADLTTFLVDNQFKVTPGNMNFAEAGARQQEYVTCANKNNSYVIQFLRGNETKITSKGPCITISIGADCRALEAVEKFKVQTVIDAKKAGLK